MIQIRDDGSLDWDSSHGGDGGDHDGDGNLDRVDGAGGGTQHILVEWMMKLFRTSSLMILPTFMALTTTQRLTRSKYLSPAQFFLQNHVSNSLLNIFTYITWHENVRASQLRSTVHNWFWDLPTLQLVSLQVSFTLGSGTLTTWTRAAVLDTFFFVSESLVH